MSEMVGFRHIDTVGMVGIKPGIYNQDDTLADATVRFNWILLHFLQGRQTFYSTFPVQ